MKKIFLLIYISLMMFIPINVYAIEIVNTQITGTTEKSIGEEFIIDYKINFDEIEKNRTTGIWLLQYEIIFDKDLLLISEITSDDFETYIYKENDKYYVISEVIENENGKNICTNGILHCGNYQSKIKFYIKNTEATETAIKIKDVQVALLDITNEKDTYTIDDIFELNNEEEKIHTIKINTTTNEITEEPKNIVVDNKPLIKEEKNIINSNKESNKSSSAFIKELKIKNYNINFDKNKTNYNITIENDINELDIDVTLENENATYKIIGSDDLKANNNEIAIIVTSEDNNTITYTINVKYNDIIEEKSNDKKIDIKYLINKYLTKDNLTYAAITIGIIIIIILLFILKNKRENKKINKLLGEL